MTTTKTIEEREAEIDAVEEKVRLIGKETVFFRWLCIAVFAGLLSAQAKSSAHGVHGPFGDGFSYETIACLVFLAVGFLVSFAPPMFIKAKIRPKISHTKAKLAAIRALDEAERQANGTSST